jgi:hypothetical protein
MKFLTPQFLQNKTDIRARHDAVISALRRLRKVDGKFQASLGYMVRSCLKRNKKTKQSKTQISRSTTLQSEGALGSLSFLTG